MKTFFEILDDLCEDRMKHKWVYVRMILSDLSKDGLIEDAAEIYASQFKVVSQEPTKEEIKEAFLNGEMGVTGAHRGITCVVAAINWYKTKTGRS